MFKKILLITTCSVLLFLFLSLICGFSYAMPPYLPEINDSLSMASGVFEEPQMPLGVNGPTAFDVNLINFFNPTRMYMFDSIGQLAPMDTLVIKDFQTLWILVDFNDHQNSTNSSFFDSLVFGNTNSVKKYYAIESGDRFQISSVNMPSQIGWVRAPQNYSYYVNSNYGFGGYPHNSQKLAEDVIDIIDTLVNFSQYDNDGDGIVDGILLIHSGSGAEFSGNRNDIWSHKWGIVPRQRDGVTISNFSCQPEFWIAPDDMTIGVFAHEFGHVIGLPDLYDTDGSSSGVGKWCLMAAGSWNGNLGNHPSGLCGWAKIKLGFTKPIQLDNSQGQIAGDDQVFKIYNLNNPVFYDLLEYRKKTGNDTHLPGNGLLITRVDESKFSNNSEWYPGNPAASHYKVAIVQPDGQWHLEHNFNRGDWGDIYPYVDGNWNVHEFTPETTPSTNWYDNSKTGNIINQIEFWDDLSNMSFVFDNCDCPYQGDIDGDNDIDIVDIVGPEYFTTGEVGGIVGIVYAGQFNIHDQNCPVQRGDINCDGFVDAIDVSVLIDIYAGLLPGACDPCE